MGFISTIMQGKQARGCLIPIKAPLAMKPLMAILLQLTEERTVFICIAAAEAFLAAQIVISYMATAAMI